MQHYIVRKPPDVEYCTVGLKPDLGTMAVLLAILIYTHQCLTAHGASLADSGCSSTYLSCTTPQSDVTLAESILHDESGQAINVIRSEVPLAWCESYQMCRDLGGELLVIDSNTTQMVVESFGVLPDSAQAWVSGTRKNHGNGWTWVTEELLDCDADYAGLFGYDDMNCSDQATNGLEYGAMADYAVFGHVPLYASDDIPLMGFCRDGMTTEVGLWHQTQNDCHSYGSSLASPTELSDLTLWSYLEFHAGLQFRPWIWIMKPDTTCSISPMIYNVWANDSRALAGEADCLATLLSGDDKHGQWAEQPCSVQLNHFMCTGDVVIPIKATTKGTGTTNPQSSGSDKEKELKLAHGFLGVFVVLTGVSAAGAIYLCLKLKSQNAKLESLKDRLDMNTLDLRQANAIDLDRKQPIRKQPDDVTCDYEDFGMADLATTASKIGLNGSGDGLEYEAPDYAVPTEQYGSLSGATRDATVSTYASLQ